MFDNNTINIITQALMIVNLLLVFSIIFLERKAPTTALTWCITLLFLPGVGFVLYMIFGTRPRFRNIRKFSRKTEYDNVYRLMLLRQTEFYSHEDLSAYNESIEKCKNLARFNAIGANSIYTDNNSVDVFTTAQDKYTALLHDIRNAKKHINMVYYIYRDDSIGRHIINALVERAKAGVKVRCIIDDAGCLRTNKRKLFKPLLEAGGELKRFSPVWSLLRLNYRNHRKIVVIDGKIGYMGGMNIGDEYMGLKKVKNWRDTHLRIMGTAVYLLQIRFLLDWCYSANTIIDEIMDLEEFFEANNEAHEGNIGMQIVSGGPDRDEDYMKLSFIQMLNEAQKDIYIQTPYFIPDQPFLEAIKTAAMSGVHIHFMIPGQYDKFLVYQGTFSYLEDIITYPNVDVYLYNGFLHSKMLIVDESVATIGTTNLDIRSFSLQFEINAFMFDTNFARKCVGIFKEDAKNSYLLTLEEYKARPIRHKMIEAIMRLVSPIL